MGAEAEVMMCQQSVVRPPPVVDVKCFVPSDVHEIEGLVTTIASPLSPPSIERIRISESSSVSVDPSSSKPKIKPAEDIPDDFHEPVVPHFTPTIRSGSFVDMGPRRNMEDEHIRIDDLSSYLGSSYTLPKPNAFYGVFDGHGGPEAAAYIRKNVMRLFFENAEFPRSSLVDDFFLGEVENSTRRAFLSADLALADETSVSSSSGTTALTAFIFGRLLMVANAGDCRAVLCRKGEAINMSQDHRPIYPPERRRVEELGGFVDDGYLNGVLSVTRALGDWDMKVPNGSSPLIADPEFRQVILSEDDEFLIIGCDGIWDVMSSQHAVNVVRRGLCRHDDPEQCARDLVKEALRLCTFDNLTVIVVCFTPLDHREPPPPQERRLRCCNFSSEALCSLRSLLDGSNSSSSR